MSKLTAERLRQVLDYNGTTGTFTWKVTLSVRAQAGKMAGSVSANGYRYIAIDGEKHLAHRLAWFYTHGVWPVDKIDHRKSGKELRTDNRISNLREATTAQNARNSEVRATNTSGFKGVSWDAKKQQWFAKITVDYRQIALGRYDSKEEAAAAYAHVAAILHGDYASLPVTSAALSPRAYMQTKFAVQRVRMKLLEEEWALRDQFWANTTVGISHIDYDRMFSAQANECAACGKEGEQIYFDSPMSLVPDIVDGSALGLLCGPCKEGVDAVRHYRAYQSGFDAYFQKHKMHKHIAAVAVLNAPPKKG